MTSKNTFVSHYNRRGTAPSQAPCLGLQGWADPASPLGHPRSQGGIGQRSEQTAKRTEITLHRLRFAKACQTELRCSKCQGIHFTCLKRKTFLSCQILVTPSVLAFCSRAPGPLQNCVSSEHLPASSSLGTATPSLPALSSLRAAGAVPPWGQPVTNPGTKPKSTGEL